MRMWVGTSGYNYPEWKGSFYPDKLPAAKMLPYYAERFTTVEINYTFYRTPNEKILAGWNRETPPGFRLTLKAPKRITHIARLRGCADLLQYFLKTAATLGPKLGAILFQLPPYFRRDLAVLDEFLQLLPAGTCAAFEFRHASWMDAEVFARLKARNLALCVADSEAHGARPTGVAEAPRQLTIGDGLTVRDGPQRLPDRQLERGACGGQPQPEGAPPPGKVLVQLRAHAREWRRVRAPLG